MTTTTTQTTTQTTPTVAHGLPGPADLRSALEETRADRRAFLQSLTADGLQTMGSDPAEATRVAGARRTLQEVDAALARMDAGEFGLCVHCGNPIPAERLEFLPQASGCVPCVQAHRLD